MFFFFFLKKTQGSIIKDLCDYSDLLMKGLPLSDSVRGGTIANCPPQGLGNAVPTSGLERPELSPHPHSSACLVPTPLPRLFVPYTILAESLPYRKPDGEIPGSLVLDAPLLQRHICHPRISHLTSAISVLPTARSA